MVNLETRSIPPWYRRQILKEQGGRCANETCLKKGMLDWNECETNHIIPWHKGGRTIRFNLEVLCITCHKNRTRSDTKQRCKKSSFVGDKPYRVHCLKCDGYGHFSKTCSRIQEKPVNFRVHCLKCDGYGHFSKTCRV